MVQVVGAGRFMMVRLCDLSIMFAAFWVFLLLGVEVQLVRTKFVLLGWCLEVSFNYPC